MFERRLEILMWMFGAAGVVIVGRLAELQIARGDYYRARAEQALIARPQQLPFVRGSIFDRTGASLVRDEPSWELKVDFEVIAAGAADDPEAIKALRGRMGRWYPNAADGEDAVEALRRDLDSTWSTIALRFTSHERPVSIAELRDRAREIYDRVNRIKQAVSARRGYSVLVAEEKMAHAVVSGLGPEAQIAAREELARYPWVSVEPAVSRSFQGDVTAFAHILGRLGRVDADDVANDPNADDPFAKYRADELIGITGVEYTAERLLRGRRGRVVVDKAGAQVEPIIEAQNGRDVTLTIHGTLQRKLYALLEEAVLQCAESPGGAVVVLDVASREVLALVSYPSYDATRFDELYSFLRDDTDRLPLRFRAVANQYAPGSIVKPLVCLAGLMGGGLGVDTHENCSGYLFPDQHDRWRCWEIHGTSARKAHGSINVVEALTGSCNVFMYRLGEALGVDSLCAAFDMFGIGRSTGIGLREEATGINPTPGWLARYRQSAVHAAHARLFAIGQGELAATPLQAANLMATYASGRFRPVTLVRTGRQTPEWTIPATGEQWSAIRQGIYSVVNDPEGTAYKHARFENDRYVLCGKTGSATAIRWPTAFSIPHLDLRGTPGTAVVRAGAKSEAIDRFTAMQPEATFDPADVRVAGEWPPHPPPDGDKYSHAWFGGYLQAVDGGGRPAWAVEPRIAFAALLEFGGSGGRRGGPLAKRVAAVLIEELGPDLDADSSGDKGDRP